MKSLTILFLASFALVAFTGCSKTSATKDAPETKNKYTLKAEGTADLKLNAEVLREREPLDFSAEFSRIDIPATKDFEAISCMVLINSTQETDTGEYKIVLLKNGKKQAEIEGKVQKGVEHNSSLGDMPQEKFKKAHPLGM